MHWNLGSGPQVYRCAKLIQHIHSHGNSHAVVTWLMYCILTERGFNDRDIASYSASLIHVTHAATCKQEWMQNSWNVQIKTNFVFFFLSKHFDLFKPWNLWSEHTITTQLYLNNKQTTAYKQHTPYRQIQFRTCSMAVDFLDVLAV